MAGRKRTTRARAQNKPLKVEPVAPAATPIPVAEAGDVLQDAIDKWGDAGDAVPQGTQMDNTNIKKEIARVEPPNPFEEQYEKARHRGLGHLARMRTSEGRTVLIPPNAELHPELGRWAYHWDGKWVILRWIGTRSHQRQRRHEQGYQYFEGVDQIKMLGLDPEVYRNERNRIAIGDAELGWVPEEFVYAHMAATEKRKEDMVAVAKDRVYDNVGEAVPDVRIMEGTEGEVMQQMAELRGGARR